MRSLLTLVARAVFTSSQAAAIFSSLSIMNPNLAPNMNTNKHRWYDKQDWVQKQVTSKMVNSFSQIYIIRCNENLMQYNKIGNEMLRLNYDGHSLNFHHVQQYRLATIALVIRKTITKTSTWCVISRLRNLCHSDNWCQVSILVRNNCWNAVIAFLRSNTSSQHLYYKYFNLSLVQWEIWMKSSTL